MSDIFKDLNLSDEEKEFIHNIRKDLGHEGNKVISQKANAIATFFLAKQIEAASKSSDKSSKAMNLLTAAIAFFALCQVLIAIFK